MNLWCKYTGLHWFKIVKADYDEPYKQRGVINKCIFNCGKYKAKGTKLWWGDKVECNRQEFKPKSENPLSHLSWKCDSCKKVRPNDFIEVYSHPHYEREITFIHNLKYCNDNPACKEQAEKCNLKINNEIGEE